MSQKFFAIIVIATFLTACAPATPATQGPDPTLVAVKATLAAEQSTGPCQVQSPPAWRFLLLPATPMKIGDVVFTVDGYTVAVNVRGAGPWTLEFGIPVQLGPFTGLCFILSGENVVMVEGSSEIPPPRGASVLP